MTSCPVCGARIHHVDRLDDIDPETPPPGAVVVCPGCGMPLIVDWLGALAAPSPEEYETAIADPVVFAAMAGVLAHAFESAESYRRRLEGN